MIVLITIFLCLSISVGIYGQSSSSLRGIPEVIFVKGGTFSMGSTAGEDRERPVRSVTLNDFSIGKNGVTVLQYRVFSEDTGKKMPDEPSWGWQDNHPIVNVNYNDAVEYCDWLGEKYGDKWRLPTEAEWEYAARGGIQSKGYNYAGGDDLDLVGWYAKNSGNQAHSVGRKIANELGIHDMNGNVWEWCIDWYGEYSGSAASNPRGPSSGVSRVLRGGSWVNSAVYCCVSTRRHLGPSYRNDYNGFRVVLS
ncbi:MAG: hypothetical protein C0433_04450 [Cyclobacterium sp.]|nr:hypothetical protein [Cyclobacterium sp.]